MNRINYRVNEMDAGKLLKDVIKTRMDVSKRLIKRLKAHPEGILVNGQHRTVRYVVEVDDEISLAMAPSEKASDIIHEMKPLTVVYEDDMVLVVDKPPGVTMFPRRRGAWFSCRRSTCTFRSQWRGVHLSSGKPIRYWYQWSCAISKK